MRKFWMILFIIALLTGGIASSASASLIFDFDRRFTQVSDGLVDQGSWGTMTLTDNGNAVDIDINLAAGYTIAALWLNYDPTATLPTDFVLSGFTGGGVSSSANNKAADGWSGRFDINVGNLTTFSDSSPFSGSLTAGAGAIDLDPALFNFKETNDIVYAMMRIGNVNIAGGPGAIGRGSAWIAATTTRSAQVPEPGTILLLGFGLIGLAGFRRKKINK